MAMPHRDRRESALLERPDQLREQGVDDHAFLVDRQDIQVDVLAGQDQIVGLVGGKDVLRGIGRIDDVPLLDRKSTRLNSSHQIISYAVFCLKKKKTKTVYE